MWRIADGGGVDQPYDSFLHQRTHTPDPERTINDALRERLVSTAERTRENVMSSSASKR